MCLCKCAGGYRKAGIDLLGATPIRHPSTLCGGIFRRIDGEGLLVESPTSYNEGSCQTLELDSSLQYQPDDSAHVHLSKALPQFLVVSRKPQAAPTGSPCSDDDMHTLGCEHLRLRVRAALSARLAVILGSQELESLNRSVFVCPSRLVCVGAWGRAIRLAWRIAATDSTRGVARPHEVGSRASGHAPPCFGHNYMVFARPGRRFSPACRPACYHRRYE